jgi:hypothetical protein
MLSGIVPLILLVPKKALILKRPRAGREFAVRERNIQILIAAYV